MRELRARALAAFGTECGEKRICGQTSLAVDFYFPRERTIVEVALGLPNPGCEYEKDILKAIMAKKCAQRGRRAVMGVVVLALLIQTIVVYALTLRFIAGVSPTYFFRQSQQAILTGFSTASSNATLPTALLVAENGLRIPRHVARFVLTVGAATNHHGSALFESVTILLLAQFFGVSLGLPEQLAVMALCVLASMGSAAVPAGSLPVLAAMLALFGIPPRRYRSHSRGRPPS